MTLARVPTNGRVAVVGAGISGLTFTYFLSKLRPDLRFDIYEQSDSIGGCIRSQYLTTPTESIILEKGPRTLRGVSEGSLLIVDMLRQLGRASSVRVLPRNSIANKKYITNTDRRIVQVPDTILTGWKFIRDTAIVRPTLLWGLLKEPFVKKPHENDSTDESIESFFTRRLGTSVLTDSVLSAIIHGIYAGDVARLSVKSILPSVRKLEIDHGSLGRALVAKKSKSEPKTSGLSPALTQYQHQLSPDANLEELSLSLKKFPMLALAGGLQTLPNSLYEYLSSQSNVQFHFHSDISQIDPVKGTVTVNSNQSSVVQYDHIRSTISTKALAKVLQVAPAITEQLRSLEYVSVFLVNIYTRTPTLIPKNGHGFGFLVPKLNGNNHNLLGVIYDSDVEQNIIPLDGERDAGATKSSSYNKITLMMGGHYYNNKTIPSSGVNIRIVKDILTDFLNIDLSHKNLIIRDEAAIESKQVGELEENDILISYNLHQDCIPQYNVGYEQLKQTMLDEFANTKLSFGGMAFGTGVGVPDCVVDSLQASLQLSK
ncbi:mitochondrial protoporphyrinogen oxidase [Scheffersomyces amazonensis]|uniref:mitochondrial protoporphyrinogen oxidase n=1 Tax=Scheffersomyces amazonensis TaxID=1078765 RepID=UPI00315D790D